LTPAAWVGKKTKILQNPIDFIRKKLNIAPVGRDPATETPNQMKTTRSKYLGILASVGFLVPATSSATLLVGFQAFDQNSLASEGHDNASSGWSGSVAKSSASTSQGGSIDTRWGNNEGLTPFPTTHNGHLVMEEGASTVFTFTNNSNTSWVIDNFFFDAASTTNTTIFVNNQVSYEIRDADNSVIVPEVTLGAPPVGPTAVQQFSVVGGRVIGGNYDYADFAALLDVIIYGGQKLLVTVTATTEGTTFLDNIAITGFRDPDGLIPEPGSLLAIGCLVGSGLLLRKRRTAA